MKSQGSAGEVDHGGLCGGGGADTLSSRDESPCSWLHPKGDQCPDPHPWQGHWALGQEPTLPPAAPVAPTPTGGRISVAETEPPSHLLLPSRWPSAAPRT